MLLRFLNIIIVFKAFVNKNFNLASLYIVK